MKFADLINLFLNSSIQDWQTISHGPLFKDRVAGDLIDSYDFLSVYEPDISITLAWGLPKFPDPVKNTVTDEWILRFGGTSKPTLHYVDLFYNNALVFRSSYILVDDSRYMVPEPSTGIHNQKFCERGYLDFITRLNHIAGKDIYQGSHLLKYVEEVNVLEGNWLD